MICNQTLTVIGQDTQAKEVKMTMLGLDLSHEEAEAMEEQASLDNARLKTNRTSPRFHQWS